MQHRLEKLLCSPATFFFFFLNPQLMPGETDGEQMKSMHGVHCSALSISQELTACISHPMGCAARGLVHLKVTALGHVTAGVGPRENPTPLGQDGLVTLQVRRTQPLSSIPTSNIHQELGLGSLSCSRAALLSYSTAQRVKSS